MGGTEGAALGGASVDPQRLELSIFNVLYRNSQMENKTADQPWRSVQFKTIQL
jgi:hypothetical protein